MCFKYLLSYDSFKDSSQRKWQWPFCPDAFQLCISKNNECVSVYSYLSQYKTEQKPKEDKLTDPYISKAGETT